MIYDSEFTGLPFFAKINYLNMIVEAVLKYSLNVAKFCIALLKPIYSRN